MSEDPTTARPEPASDAPSNAPSSAPSNAPSSAPSSAPSNAPSNAPSSAPSSAQSDAGLLRAHVEGDPEAFGELFARHRDRLWAVALRTMGNPEDAADGLQDGMIAAFRRAGSFRGEAAVTTWLHRVVVNACLDRLRAAKVRRADALPDDLEDRGGRGSLVTQDGTHDPADLSVAADRRRRVLDALATLPPAQRAALVLVDMEGYPVHEVAEMLGCAEGTVKSRCFRGRARLAELLGDLDPTREESVEGNQPESGPVPTDDQPRGPPTQPGTSPAR